MGYTIVKSIHVIGFISWFAGLLYLVRLFVYHTEAFEKTEPSRTILHQQFSIMERRLLLGITLPAAILSLVTGLILMVQIEAYKEPWFHMKALLVLLLLIYTHRCGKWRKSLATGQAKYSSKYFRIQNEVATFLMIGIAFAVITKNPLISVVAMGIALALGLVLFKVLARKKTQ